MPHSLPNRPNLAANLYTSETPVLSNKADYLLIVDDSNQIRSALVANIVKACQMVGRPYQLMNTEQVQATAGTEQGRLLNIYTATSPSDALSVLGLAEVQRLVVVSDIMMPRDSKVGLFGLLQELAERRLPVHLIFASSEKQNRYYVEDVIQSGKASFTEKGGANWGQLPFWLVENTPLLDYKIIMRSDFDRAYSQADGRNSGTVVAGLPTDTHKATHSRLAWSQPQSERAETIRGGFWNWLTFWKR